MSRSDPLPIVSDRLFLLDAAAIGVSSVLICLFAQQLLLMSIAMPTLIALRCGGYWWLTRLEGRTVSLNRELLLLAICTLLGGFNDWNSVVNKRIYDYTVPVYFPAISTIPVWMLLYWGLILRFLLSLFRWQRLRPPSHSEDVIWLPAKRAIPGPARVAVLLALVLVTRQFIYRYYADPWLSWLPFVAALATYVVLFRPSRYLWRLLALFLAGGPAIEILYIQLGGLHAYHLGWLGGVPLWIAVWWVLIVPIWADIGTRLWRQLADHRNPPVASRPEHASC